jgi:hypothetical protein
MQVTTSRGATVTDDSRRRAMKLDKILVPLDGSPLAERRRAPVETPSGTDEEHGVAGARR